MKAKDLQTLLFVIALLTLLLAGASAKAQNVGVGTATPNASAALDVVSTSKGLLTPRLTQAQIQAIVGPATGLLVYQTNGAQPGFYYNAGTGVVPFWTRLNTDIAGAGDNLGNHTAAQNLDLGTHALVGSSFSIGNTVGLGVRADGGLNIGENTVGNNVFIGYQAGLGNSTGATNMFLGYKSGVGNASGSGNLFIGSESGWSNNGHANQFIGLQSGRYNQTGGGNQFSGFQSGYNSQSGDFNYFSGYQSGYSNTAGENNLFIGPKSGYSNTTASTNQFVGSGAGYANTTGNGNLFSGYQSGRSNQIGSENQFTGFRSGQRNLNGNANQFSGYLSGEFNTSGDENLFTGYQSGAANTTGNMNWSYGYESGPGAGSSNLTRAGAIGYKAKVSQSNSLVLGGTGADAVKVGIGTTTPRGILDVAGPGNSYLVANPEDGNQQRAFLPGSIFLAPNKAGTDNVAYLQARQANGTGDVGMTLRTCSNNSILDAVQIRSHGYVKFNGAPGATFAGPVDAPAFYTFSDQRLKQDIRPLGGALAAVRQLRGVRYTYRQDIEGKPLPKGEQVGVLAQEVEKLYPELVSTAPNGYKAVNYSQLTPVLLEALKEQQQQIDTLKAQATSAIQRADRAEAITTSFGQRLQALEAAGARATR